MLSGKYISFCLIAVTVLFSCSGKPAFVDASFGSNITKTGLISDKNLKFSFKYGKGGLNRDLYNFIYFEGDTVCFSFNYNADIDKDVRVWYIDAKTGRKKAAERIEVLRSRVFGFSLAGSLLEFFRSGTLDKELGNERSIVQEFVVRVEAFHNGEIISAEKKGEFTVTY
jgi:hypothetical protein